MYENIYCAFCKGRRVLTEHFGGADLCELGISKEEPGKFITGLLDFTMNYKEAPVLRHANECSCLETFDYYRVRSYLSWERSGSVVECLTRDRRAAGSSLTGVTALWSLSKTHLS